MVGTLAFVISLFALVFTAEEAAGDAGVLGASAGLVLLLAAAALVAMAVKRLKVPYTVALVVVGLGLSFFPNFLSIEISDELILAILVPPLLFEGTMHMSWRKLKADLPGVLFLALGGTLLGTLMVGGIVEAILGIPWLAAIAFGALISATDPVAVIAFFRSLGVDKRLTILVEGESLFNDGVAIVVFTLATAAAASGEALTVGTALGSFIVVAFGGLAVGFVLGYVVSNIILKNLDDHLIETSVTVALAFGSYVLAEEFGLLIGQHDLHLSGILAVVAAGLTVGNAGFQNTSPTTRLTIENFWEFLAFVVNSIVFLLIGLQLNILDLETFTVGEIITDVLVAVVAVLLARALIVYLFTAIINKVRPQFRISMPYQHVMYWGGLRGAVSLALALTVASSFDAETTEILQVMTFGVVLFTLLVQGTTISGLIRRLGLADKPEAIVEQQRKQATMVAKRAGRAELDRLRRQGVLYPQLWSSLDGLYDEEIENVRDDLGTHFQTHPELETTMFLQARSDSLNAERSAVLEASRRGLISSEVAEEMIEQLNNRLSALGFIESRLTHNVDLPTAVDPNAFVTEPTDG